MITIFSVGSAPITTASAAEASQAAVAANASGDFEVPDYTKVELNLGTSTSSTGLFDSTAKADLNTFTVNKRLRAGCFLLPFLL